MYNRDGSLLVVAKALISTPPNMLERGGFVKRACLFAFSLQGKVNKMAAIWNARKCDEWIVSEWHANTPSTLLLLMFKDVSLNQGCGETLYLSVHPLFKCRWCARNLVGLEITKVTDVFCRGMVSIHSQRSRELRPQYSPLWRVVKPPALWCNIYLGVRPSET